MSVEVYAFTLPLRRPLHMGGQTIERRQGLLLALSDGQGHRGFGEAAPLPGFQKETWAECSRQLPEIAGRLYAKTVPENILELNGALSSLLPVHYGLHAAVRFALESALVNLAAAVKGKILAAALNGQYRPQVRVNGILFGDGDAAAQAATLAAQKYASIKMKVGRASPEKERARVLAVLQALPPAVTLRLDANRAWSLEEALSFAGSLPAGRIEYIEEPLKEPRQLEMFYRQTRLPYALDESLLQEQAKEINRSEGLAALVIKPALLGSLERSKRLIAEAEKLSVRAVLSDAFGSGVTLSVLCALAAAFIPADTAMGLDTYRFLKEDILRERLEIVNGRIDVLQSGLRAQHVNTGRLERVV